MKLILKQLCMIDTILPFLAVRSLFAAWEGEFTCDPQYCRVVDGTVEGTHRDLWLPGMDTPLLKATYAGDKLSIALDSGQPLPQGMAALLVAMGLVFRGGEGGVSTHTPLDAEVLYARTLDLDNTWMVLRRMAPNHPTSEDLVRNAQVLLELANAWHETTLAIGNTGGSPALETQAAGLMAKADNFHALKIPGLESLKLLPDYRGSALTAMFTGRDYESLVCSVKLDWAAGRITSSGPEAPQRKPGKFDVRPTRVPQNILDVLGGVVIEGHEVSITQRLASAFYAKVNAFLQDIGGKWSTSRQAHVFEEDPAPVLEEILRTGEVFTSRDYEFFETTAPLAARVIAKAGLEPGMMVLEPNGGGGALAMAAAEIVGRENVTCYELMDRNVKKLKALGFKLEGPQDFLSVTPSEIFDRVLINPPFSNFRDAEHITHAFKFLRPGGVLSGIASTQWQTHDTAPARKFQAFVAALGGEVEQVPAGAFKASGTDVPTTMLLLRKPGIAVARSLEIEVTAAKQAPAQVCLF